MRRRALAWSLTLILATVPFTGCLSDDGSGERPAPGSDGDTGEAGNRTGEESGAEEESRRENKEREGVIGNESEGVAGNDSDTPALELSLAPGNVTLAPGEVVNFTATLVVHERVNITHRGCPPGLVDIDAHVGEERVHLYPYGEEPRASACAIRTVTLEPGTYNVSGNWNGHLEPGDSGAPHTGPAAEPGAYNVTARLVAQDRDLMAASTVRVTG